MSTCRWQENFVNYHSFEECFIYCDTNASYASIHQFLEGGQGKPCVVANGNVATKGDAGACLAISYEARSRGIQRGSSLMQAKKLVKDLVVYESCLPLYEIYADLYDGLLEVIFPKEMCYRASCDEVVISFSARKLPYKDFQSTVGEIQRHLKLWLNFDLVIQLDAVRRAHLQTLPKVQRVIYALCYALRDVLFQILGLPLSIAVAPSICLAKALIDQAKPTWRQGRRYYGTLHDAIAFPTTREEANAYLRTVKLKKICGVSTVAERLGAVGYKTVADVQDHCGLDMALRLAQNIHLGKVLWYSCHGRDEVLPGYLAAIRDRK